MSRKYISSGKYKKDKKDKLSDKERKERVYQKQIEGMIKGVQKAHEVRAGWPEWKKGTFERLIEKSGQRYTDIVLKSGRRK